MNHSGFVRNVVVYFLCSVDVAPLVFLRLDVVPVAPPITSFLARRKAARTSFARAFKNSLGNKLLASAARLRRSFVFYPNKYINQHYSSVKIPPS